MFSEYELPLSKKAIGEKQVYGSKVNKHGEITRSKSHRVAFANRQREGVTLSRHPERLRTPLPSNSSLQWRSRSDSPYSILIWGIRFVRSDFDNEIYLRLYPRCGSMSRKDRLLDKTLYRLGKQFVDGVNCCRRLRTLVFNSAFPILACSR